MTNNARSRPDKGWLLFYVRFKKTVPENPGRSYIPLCGWGKNYASSFAMVSPAM